MTDAPQKAKKTKKGRKVGRAANFCTRYKNEHRREKNKLRRALKRQKQHPNDSCLAAAIANHKLVLGIKS